MRRTTLLAVLAAGFALAWPGFAEEAGMVCADCHDEVAAGMTHQIHMRIQPFEVYGRQVGCEGCHGDGTQHMEEGDPALIRTFKEKSTDDNAACMSCHVSSGHSGRFLNSTGVSEWQVSTHAMENLACVDCHAIHGKSKPLSTCKSCHTEVYAQFQLPNHHPVPEGKMSCNNCHNPHSANEYMLTNNNMRLNDLCYTCHQSQEGPFIFEHSPVQESCSLCHMPHGSVADKLLTANEPMLCLQCHEFHFHAALISPEGPTEVGGTEYENPEGEYSMNAAFTTKCSQCHSQVHGTDLPSQSLAGAGFGGVR